MAEEERLKPELVIEAPPVPRQWSPEQVEHFLSLLDRTEQSCVSYGMPAITDWWRTQIETFFRSGKRRWVIRVGRRGGKSSTLMRVLVTWALSRMWYVSPGTMAVIPILSVDKKEAGDRLLMIETILKALGLVEGQDYRLRSSQSGGDICLLDRTMEFRVYAAKKTTVGFTGIALFGDEVAHWSNVDTGANPAKVVMASIRPAMASQPMAFEILASAPWGTSDYHAELYDAGDTAEQCVSYAPTWVANDNFISEQESHRLEPDPKEWLRAYKAVPGATVSTAFDRSEVLASFRADNVGALNERGWVALDPSELREDAFAIVAGRTTTSGELLVQQIEGWEDSELRGVDYDQICDRVAQITAEYRTGEVYGDQLEQASLTGHFANRNRLYVVYNWSNGSKHAAVTRLRRLMRERRLLIGIDHPQLRRQLLECKAEKTPNGQTRYETNGLDYLSALLTAIHACNDGRIPLQEAPGLDWDDYDAQDFPEPADGL